MTMSELTREAFSTLLDLASRPRSSIRLVLDGSTLKAGWKALRPFSLVIAGFSCLLGLVLALSDGPIDWINAAAALVSGTLLQAGVNLVNDFFEFKQRRLDDKIPHLAITGERRETLEWLIFYAGMAALCAGGLIGLFITLRVGWPMAILGIAGLIGGYGYTGEPIAYKRRGLGVPIVFFLMGVLMAAGSYYAASGRFSWSVVWTSLPVSALVSFILMTNELRDWEADTRHGIRTLAVRIGYKKAVIVSFALLACAYGGTCALAASGLAPLGWLALLALPFAVPPMVLIFKPADRRAGIIPLVMLHHLAFGVAFLSGYLPFIRL